MELELGLKITTAGEFTYDFQTKQEHGEDLVFLSRETDSVFILSAHLKGYTRRNITIDIHEDGTLLSIRGERQVKGTVVVERKAYKDMGINGFKKVFRIPDGVDLDKIKAKLDKDVSSYTRKHARVRTGYAAGSSNRVAEENIDDNCDDGASEVIVQQST